LHNSDKYLAQSLIFNAVFTASPLTATNDNYNKYIKEINKTQ